MTGLVFFRANAGELARDAGGPDRLQGVAARCAGRPGSPKRLGSTAVHPAAATRRPNSATRGRDARDLADHDHGGARADAVDVASLAVGLERLLGEPLERGLPPALIAGRHGRTVASTVVAGPSRSLDPRLPVLVGLGTAERRCARRRPHDRGGARRRRRCRRTRAARRRRLHRGARRARGRSPTRRARWPGASGRPGRARSASRSACRNKRSSTTCSRPWRPASYGTVVVVGGEARRWARDGGSETDEEGAPPDEVVSRPPDFVAPIERGGRHRPAAGAAVRADRERAGGRGAADAGRAARRDRGAVGPLQRGRPRTTPRPRSASPAERRRDRHARARATARWPTPTTCGTPASGPWTSRRPSLICSAERARAAGVPPDRWLFPHVALHCSAAVTLTARRRLSAWPAMAVLGRAAEAHLGRPLRDIGAGRGVLVLPCCGAGPATRARARSCGHPDADAAA